MINQIACSLDSIPPKNVEELYDGVGECERFQSNDGFCAQPLHSIEECNHKMTDDESHVRT